MINNDYFIVTMFIQSLVYDSITTISNNRSNSEVKASDLLENPKKCFLDTKYKSSTTLSVTTLWRISIENSKHSLHTMTLLSSVSYDFVLPVFNMSFRLRIPTGRVSIFGANLSYKGMLFFSINPLKTDSTLLCG